MDPVNHDDRVELALAPLPWPTDPGQLLARLNGFEHRVWLDSPPGSGELGRYSIISAAPVWHLRCRNARCCTISRDGLQETITADPWALLTQKLAGLARPRAAADLPFTGGLIGAAGYESCHGLHALEPVDRADRSDDLSVGLYTWAIVLDNQTRTAALVTHPATPGDLKQRIRHALQGPVESSQTIDEPFHLLAPFRPAVPRQDYLRQVEQIQRYLRAGDCYQVNLSQAFHAPCEGSPLNAYLRLRTRFPNPFSAWLELGDSTLLGLSPERFLASEHGRIETRPIKGTRPRGATPEEDAALASQLVASDKERAENLMIVDLMRNDLGRCSKTGTVRVRELFRVESYPTVHHLVSVVGSELRDDCNALELLRQCLPGGSITGAPKRRAMQIIDELETASRRFYCGSVFYLDCRGRLDSNIAIRSLEVRDGEIRCWGGGGIVADSNPDDEYRETLDKVGTLMAALEETTPDGQ